MQQTQGILSGGSYYFPSDAKPASHGAATSFSRATLQTDLNTFVTRANCLADEILNNDAPARNSDSERVVIIRHYHSPWYSPVFWYTPVYEPIYVVPSRGRGDSDDASRVLVGILAVVVGGIALFALGSAIPRYTDAESELETTHDFRQKIEYYPPQNQQEAEIISQVKAVSDLKEKICRRIRDSAIADVVLRAVLVAGCALALVAAFSVTAKAMMTLGIITGLVAAGGMLFKWGFEGSDRQNIRDAQALREALRYLQH